jgi:Cu(I)/Ag(I) efflux system membrane fusion protein
MRRLSGVIILAIGLTVSAAGRYWYDQYLHAASSPIAAATSPAAATERKILYYRDPNGAPYWSVTPKKDVNGRDYLPVYADEEPTFGPGGELKKPTQAASAPRKILYYRNPMGLPDTSPSPKKDSMGMDYVPVYEGDDSDDGSIRLSPGKIQRTGVKSEPAARRVIRTLVHAPGTIQLDERRVSVISMRAESWVQKVENVTTGTKVAKGQPLMEIYSPAIGSAAADYISTLNSKTTAGEASYGRGSRQRLMNLDVPEPAIAAMEKSRVVPLTIAWSAPRDGLVLERNAVEGMRAQPGDVLFRVADISVVWAMIDVAERDLGALAVGQPVSIRARGWPGRTFSGSISVIYPQVNRDTRTSRARVELANPDVALLPDMYVDADINTGSPEPVLAIPESAVLDTGTRQAAFVDKGEGRFEPRAIELGRRGEGYVEVRDGVANGEPVVVSANFLIDAESNLRAALKGFAEAGAPASSEQPTGKRP